MLIALGVQDFVIVDRLRLEFEPGFTVLTGETGAGKSILIDALLLALGARADAAQVRAGADRADITAEFELADAPAAAAWLAAHDLAGEEGECILRRMVDAGGRSRAVVNGRPVTVAQLRELGELLVDIHGQHEHQALMRAAAQRGLLDEHAGATGLVREVTERFRAWQAAREALTALERDAQAMADERDRLAWQVEEVGRVCPTPAQWDEWQADHQRLAHAAALMEGAEAGVEALTEGDAAVAAGIGAVRGRLEALAHHDPGLRGVLELLDAADIQISEASHALRQYRSRLELDPGRLQDLEARLEAVTTLARKYRVRPEALGERLAQWRARLAELGHDLDAEALRLEAGQLEQAWREAATRLSGLRAEAARSLGRAVTAAMQQLAMAGGVFEVALRPLDPPAAHGLEQVEFLVAGHPGVAPAPVSRVASGGELARLSLAIQTVASRGATVSTLVFDEVDSGIGGGVAEVVGRMLRDLGRSRQVFCITHLPQVAATAAHQWRVAKHSRDGATVSTVEVLAAGARVEEIARMLGGVEITATTRMHAGEMLAAGGVAGAC
jgi:DNA repair protein RecN (Recombination protein N)